MEKLIEYIGLVIKAVIFMALLAIFCVLFLLPVMTQYSEKYSNIAKLSKTADKVEVPTISICTGWKKSVMDNYKITMKFIYTPTSNKSNLPTDATVRNVYSDITYKLNEDFKIGLVEGFPKKPKSLMLGMNEIVAGKAIKKYDVKEVPTSAYGICYAIIPNDIFMKPYVDRLTLLLAKNNTSKEDKMDEIMVQISSNDTLHTIGATAPAMNNEMISSDFELQNYLDILYTEENTEYIKDCSEISFFKCYGTRIAESEEFKCPKKCVSLTYQAIMDTIAHNMPRCETDAENYCMGRESTKTIYKLKSTCQKQCNYKGSKLAINKSGKTYPYQLGTMQITVRLRFLPELSTTRNI